VPESERQTRLFERQIFNLLCAAPDDHLFSVFRPFAHGACRVLVRVSIPVLVSVPVPVPVPLQVPATLPRYVLYLGTYHRYFGTYFVYQ
jgi:hypothetical protein